MKCQGCGITMPEVGENPDPDALLCDTCAQKLEDSQNLLLRPTTVAHGSGTTCFHYGRTVNSEVPIIGIASAFGGEFINEECDNGIDLNWEDHKATCHKRNHEKCDVSDSPSRFLIGGWRKVKGLWEPKPKAEYSAMVDFESGYVIIYRSKYFERHALCSPCYAGCGDVDSEGEFLCYVLPPDVVGGAKTTNQAEG